MKLKEVEVQTMSGHGSRETKIRTEVALS